MVTRAETPRGVGRDRPSPGRAGACRLGPCLALLAGSLGAGCGDDATISTTPAGGELWMLQTRLFVGDGAVGYAIAAPTIDGVITNAVSIEQGGGGMVYAPPSGADGSFLLSYAEQPTLTRYQVSADNQLVEGTTLSFANYGVESGYGSIAWVDEHTAYWFDDGGRQLIRFDPTDMVISGAVPIDGTEREGYVTEFSGYPVVREDGVYFTVRWRKEWEDPEPQAPSGSVLVRVDPQSDAVTVTSDPRCTSLLVAQTTATGDTYWFSDNYNTYARIIGGASRGVPDCSLRLLRGEQTFDPSWSLDITQRTGGRPADGTVAGDGSTIWLSVFHEEQLPEPPPDIDTADVAPAWQWYALDVESDAPAVANAQSPYASHGAFGWYTDSRAFSSTVNEDYTLSTLLELTPDGFEERATIQGLLDGIVRVR